MEQKVIFNCLHSKERGGIETSFLSYNTLLKELGYRVICLVPSEYCYFDDLEKQGIAFEILNINGHYDFFAAFKLQQLVKKYQPLLLLSHKDRSNSVIHLWRKLFKPAPYPKTVYVSHLGGFYKHSMSFDAIFTVNPLLKRDFIRKGFTGQVHYMQNFHVRQPYSKPTKTNTHAITFGMISRLSPEKEIPFAISALKDILTQNPHHDIQLLIAGEGAEKQRIEACIEELNLSNHVQLIGWVKEKSNFFDQIDALLLTSSAESFGMVLIEAFNYQTPVISSRTNGGETVVTHGVNGLLFDTLEKNDLVEKMQLVISHPEIMQELSENAQSHLESLYSKDSVKTTLKKATDTILQPQNLEQQDTAKHH